MPDSKYNNTGWEIYESNVQAYRSNFLASQSIMLAVGAILLGHGLSLIIIIAAIGLFQIWYIWFRVILIRTRIVDYHKYSIKFQINELFDNKGKLITPDTQCQKYLSENKYANDRKVRYKVNEYIRKKLVQTGELKLGEKFKNIRMTRFKLDVLLPISITIIWVIFVLYEILNKHKIIL